MGADVDPAPEEIESTQRFSKVAASLEHAPINSVVNSCAEGTGYAGSFGNGEDNALISARKIAMPEGAAVKAVALGPYTSCNLDPSGLAYCWGGGRKGVGTGTGNSTPLPVLGGLKYTSLAASDSFACGIASNGAWCWGANGSGQLGNGGSADSPIPVRVANQDQFDD
jgi:hypothetical protein